MAETRMKLGALLIPWMEGNLLTILLLTLLQCRQGLLEIIFIINSFLTEHLELHNIPIF